MRKNKNKKVRLVTVLLILVLLISVGYATLISNLTITGSTTIKKPTLNVYFTNVQVESGSVSGAKVTKTPTTSGTTTTQLEWEVSLGTPGEYYEFNVDVVNDGDTDLMVNTETNDIVSALTVAQQKYLEYTITYVNGAIIEKYDKLAAGETKTLTIKLLFKQDVNPGDLPAEGESGVSLGYEANYVPADGNAVTKVTTVTPAEPLEIGSNVNYSTTLNGQTLDSWRVFYIDGDYTYIILSEELPNAAISDTIKQNYELTAAAGAHSVNTNDYTKLVNAMQTKSNWNALLTGTLNGRQIALTQSENVWAMGSPTKEIWDNSWNAKYPDDRISNYYEIAQKDGYNNTLYFPHQLPEDAMYDENRWSGYWLASIDEWQEERVYFIDYTGRLDSFYSSMTGYGFRPIICLPTSELN